MVLEISNGMLGHLNKKILKVFLSNCANNRKLPGQISMILPGKNLLANSQLVSKPFP